MIREHKAEPQMRFGVFSRVGYSLQRVSRQVQALRIETPCIFEGASVNQDADSPAYYACNKETSADPD
jgi:hypothetical protein